MRALRPKKLTPRVDFNPLLHRRQTFNQGLRLWWQRAVRCPCVRVHSKGGKVKVTKEPVLRCEGCGGSSYIYEAHEEILAVSNEAMANPQWLLDTGELGVGMMRFSLLPEHLPSRFDKITLIDSVRVLTEQRKRRSDVEMLWYPVLERWIETGFEHDDTEAVLVEVGVHSVYMSGADGRIIMDGDTPLRLTVGTDAGDSFDIVDGKVDWTAGSGPKPELDQYYSIRYEARPVYVVRTIPHLIRDNMVQDRTPVAEHTNQHVRVDCWLEDLGDPFAELFAARDPFALVL